MQGKSRLRLEHAIAASKWGGSASLCGSILLTLRRLTLIWFDCSRGSSSLKVKAKLTIHETGVCYHKLRSSRCEEESELTSKLFDLYWSVHP